MYILSTVEQSLVSGAMASMQFGPEGIVFITTGSSVNTQAGKVNGVSYNMIMYSDYITDLSANIIFQGTSGVFCHLGNSFTVSPVSGGSKVFYTGSCS